MMVEWKGCVLMEVRRLVLPTHDFQFDLKEDGEIRVALREQQSLHIGVLWIVQAPKGTK
jgi:hypothetical protein